MNTIFDTPSLKYLARYQKVLTPVQYRNIRETIGTMAMEGMNLEDHDIDALVHLAQGQVSLTASLHQVTSSLIDAA